MYIMYIICVIESLRTDFLNDKLNHKDKAKAIVKYRRGVRVSLEFNKA